MKNPLAKKYTTFGLLRFTLPTIVMMVFMSLYTMVDGIFVSRFISTTALSAVNIVFPVVCFVIAVGIMLGQLFFHPLLRVLGANEVVWQFCYDCGRVLLWFVPLAILQMIFQYFFVVAARPGLGLAVTVAGGVTNIVLDWVFIVPGGMGVAGAALATGIGYAIPGLFGLWYFTFRRGGSLYFVKPKFDGWALFKTCTNGASEMVTNLSMAVTTLIFNLLMMRYLGEDGVAAITIVLYAQYLLTSLFLGYSSGVGPLISYNHGSGDTGTLRKLFKISMSFIGVFSGLSSPPRCFCASRSSRSSPRPAALSTTLPSMALSSFPSATSSWATTSSPRPSSPPFPTARYRPCSPLCAPGRHRSLPWVYIWQKKGLPVRLNCPATGRPHWRPSGFCMPARWATDSRIPYYNKVRAAYSCITHFNRLMTHTDLSFLRTLLKVYSTNLISLSNVLHVVSHRFSIHLHDVSGRNGNPSVQSPCNVSPLGIPLPISDYINRYFFEIPLSRVMCFC